MATIICPNCRHELTEYTRFCPQCGARLPEPEAAGAAPAAEGEAKPAATVLLPPAETPVEGEAKPAPVAPTVRLDAPAAPTVLLPPAEAPAEGEAKPAPVAPTVVLPPAAPPPSALPPTARLDTPAAAPGEPAPVDTPTVIGAPSPAAPPPVAPTASEPPAYSGGLPTGAPYPAGQQAGYAGGLPAGGPNPGEQQAARGGSGRKLLLWGLALGGGCLALVLVAICAIGVLTLLGSRVDTVFEPTAVSGPIGGGGIVPDDSPLTGGDVLFEDSFDDPDASGLGVDEDTSSRYAYEDGAYVIEVKEPETIVWARVDGSYEDVRIAVDTEIPPGADVSSAGLIFNYQDSDNFYLFSITNDGYYMLELFENGEWIVLLDSTQSDAIDATRNRLRVETQGDRITLFVNDELVEETSDGTFAGGEVGLAVTSLQDTTAEVRFDNLVIERNE